MFIHVPPKDAPRLIHKPWVLGKTIAIHSREWVVYNSGETNLFLTELAGLEVLGDAQSEIDDEREFMPVFKHWQALALDLHWCECPRCGGNVPNSIDVGRYPGALSRWDNTTYICSECGQQEAMLQMAGEDISPNGPHKWIEKERK